MAEFCSARSNIISPPQWTSLSQPFTRSEAIVKIDGYPNKSFYIHLLRDQLTSHELLFLACIGLYSEGKESFKEFSEKYTLLKMLDKVSPFMPFFEEQYDRSAFG